MWEEPFSSRKNRIISGIVLMAFGIGELLFINSPLLLGPITLNISFFIVFLLIAYRLLIKIDYIEKNNRLDKTTYILFSIFFTLYVIQRILDVFVYKSEGISFFNVITFLIYLYLLVCCLIESRKFQK